MVLQGKSVSRGIAMGRAMVYQPSELQVEELHCAPANAGEMLEKFNFARKTACLELDTIIAFFSEEPEKGAIFLAQKEILQDEDIYALISKAILEKKEMPDYAVKKAFAKFIEMMKGSSSELFAARAADLQDVCDRVIRILQGKKQNVVEQITTPVVIVAKDLLPSDTATLGRGKILGIVTEQGSITSHTAILANAMRIPAVLGVQDCMTFIEDGATVIVDAIEGEVYIDASPKVTGELTEKKSLFEKEEQEQQNFADGKVKLYTTDGRQIELGINVGQKKVEEEHIVCDFVGLFRTEFMYMKQDRFPTEEEQVQVYKEFLRQAQGRPVTLRTLDIGGDKSLPYALMEEEKNPFLGKRAIRFCFANPAILHTQLRAALRASVEGPLHIMFPMVNSVEDVMRAREMFLLAKQSLQEEQVVFCKDVKMGIMIEVPSAVMVLKEILPLIDFASVGTNDLCQYLCAADRMNPNVAEYFQMFAPAMLRVLKEISHQFLEAKKPLSVCGEMAGTVEGAAFLVGIGIDKLSMSASKLARVKTFIAKYSEKQLEQMANEALGCKTQAEVQLVFENFFEFS